MKGLPLFAAVCCSLAAPLLRAQELASQPTPFTAWVDLRPASRAAPAPAVLPIWLEKTETHLQKTREGKVVKTVVRIRFRRFAGLNDEMLLRLFFRGPSHPVVSAWSEIGARILPPKSLGDGLDAPASETLVLPMLGVDYVDIETPGDGSNLQGAFLTTLRKTEARSALDFSAPAPVADPFENAPPASPKADDALLFGRVKATLENGVVPLTAENGGSSVFGFELARPPLIAVVTFEIANADIASPPEVLVNERELGQAAMVLPDLADPAYTGDTQPRSEAVFHYTGWLKCQKALPGSALLAGPNTLQISSRSGAVAIRAVEVQLKYTAGPDTP